MKNKKKYQNYYCDEKTLQTICDLEEKLDKKLKEFRKAIEENNRFKLLNLAKHKKFLCKEEFKIFQRELTLIAWNLI